MQRITTIRFLPDLSGTLSILFEPRFDCSAVITERISAGLLCPVVLAGLLHWGGTELIRPRSHLARR